MWALDKRTSHFDAHKHAYRPDVKSCTFKVSRYSEVPSDKPILLNCGAGVVAPRAYKILQEKRKDLKSLCYIAGTPLFSEYNEWLKSNKEK